MYGIYEMMKNYDIFLNNSRNNNVKINNYLHIVEYDHSNLLSLPSIHSVNQNHGKLVYTLYERILDATMNIF